VLTKIDPAVTLETLKVPELDAVATMLEMVASGA
jgi:hypothetical protein